MAQPPPAVWDLARQLLRHESGGSRDPEALAAAVDRVVERLRDQLETLIGPGGASALLRRALTLAKREFAFLDGVATDGHSREGLRGLPESLRGQGPEQAEAASAAVLAHLLGLLVNLMGEELGLRPARKIWPDVVSGDAASVLMEAEG